jgi:hypothetical protein
MSHVIATQADQQFNKSMDLHKKSHAQLIRSLQECIRLTAKQLCKVARLFGRNDNIAALNSDVVSALASTDIDWTGQIRRSLVAYVRTVDRSNLDFADPTPEAHFFIAALNLQDALDNWTSDNLTDLDDAHGATVRARASLNELDDGFNRTFRKGRG